MTKLKLQVASPPTALQETRARKGAPLWRELSRRDASGFCPHRIRGA